MTLFIKSVLLFYMSKHVNRQNKVYKMVAITITIVLVVVLPVIVKLVQKNQENRSKAALSNTLIDGICGNRKSNPCYKGTLDESLEDTDSEIVWTCKGSNGGVDEICTQLK